MTAYRLWPQRFMLATLGVFFAVVGFNFSVDPYGIYGVFNIAGWNDNKHIATNFSRTIKPYLLKRLQPKGLILGSSRAEVGLDPEHPGWGQAAQPVYNYSVGGPGIEEVSRRFTEAVARAPIRRALVGLDFYMFNAYLNDLTPVYAVKSDWHLYLKTLFTVDATKNSIESLRKSDPQKFPGLLKNGQIAWSFNDHRVKKFGHRNSFLRFEKHFLEDTLFPLPYKSYDFYNPHRKNDAFAQLSALLKAARDQQVDLRLFISPVHARMLIVYQQNGLWDKYKEWKRQLVKMLVEEVAAYPGREAFPLYDFSGINPVTVENVPAEGDTLTKMRYYWEGSHYKKETGDLIQSRIWGEGEGGLAGFGHQLEIKNIEKILADTDMQLEEYIKTHRQDYEEIANMKNMSNWRPPQP